MYCLTMSYPVLSALSLCLVTQWYILTPLKTTVVNFLPRYCILLLVIIHPYTPENHSNPFLTKYFILVIIHSFSSLYSYTFYSFPFTFSFFSSKSAYPARSLQTTVSTLCSNPQLWLLYIHNSLPMYLIQQWHPPVP
jgi:hypothetical protein